MFREPKISSLRKLPASGGGFKQITEVTCGLSGVNLRKTGSEMEDIAAEYLSARGVRILERNYRTREAEIDIIGAEGGTILFVEVKARGSGQKSGTASEAVGTAKQKRVCRCADYYLHSRRIDPYRTGIRFDVVAITMKEEIKDTEPVREIRWIRNAFPYVSGRRSKPHWRVW